LRIRCTIHCCTTVRSHVVVIASGRPLSPLQTAINTSSTPLFFSSENTCCQKRLVVQVPGNLEVTGPGTVDMLLAPGEKQAGSLIAELGNTACPIPLLAPVTRAVTLSSLIFTPWGRVSCSDTDFRPRRASCVVPSCPLAIRFNAARLTELGITATMPGAHLTTDSRRGPWSHRILAGRLLRTLLTGNQSAIEAMAPGEAVYLFGGVGGAVGTAV
jgi:hypothetical protein